MNARQPIHVTMVVTLVRYATTPKEVLVAPVLVASLGMAQHVQITTNVPQRIHVMMMATTALSVRTQLVDIPAHAQVALYGMILLALMLTSVIIRHAIMAAIVVQHATIRQEVITAPVQADLHGMTPPVLISTSAPLIAIHATIAAIVVQHVATQAEATPAHAQAAFNQMGLPVST